MQNPNISEDAVSPPRTSPTKIFKNALPSLLVSYHHYTSEDQGVFSRNRYYSLPPEDVPSLCGSIISSANPTPDLFPKLFEFEFPPITPENGMITSPNYTFGIPPVSDFPIPLDIVHSEANDKSGQFKKPRFAWRDKTTKEDLQKGTSGVMEEVDYDFFIRDCQALPSQASIFHDDTSYSDAQSEASSGSDWCSLELESASDEESVSLFPASIVCHNKIVLELLESFQEWQRNSVHTSRGGPCESGLATNSSTTSSSKTNSSTTSTPSSTPRKDDHSFPESKKRLSDDDDDELPPPKRSKFNLSDEEVYHRALACPFAKNDPMRYRKCFGYTKLWTIARLK